MADPRTKDAQNAVVLVGNLMSMLKEEGYLKLHVSEHAESTKSKQHLEIQKSHLDATHHELQKALEHLQKLIQDTKIPEIKIRLENVTKTIEQVKKDIGILTNMISRIGGTDRA
jgi:hypothetical protein